MLYLHCMKSFGFSKKSKSNWILHLEKIFNIFFLCTYNIRIISFHVTWFFYHFYFHFILFLLLPDFSFRKSSWKSICLGPWCGRSWNCQVCYLIHIYFSYNKLLLFFLHLIFIFYIIFTTGILCSVSKISASFDAV